MTTLGQNNPLGKKTAYCSEYAPRLLCPIPRQINRDRIGLPSPLPFHGVDIWNMFELSWLNSKGKPIVALAEMRVPCTSPCIVESKSIKLYLNSFNNTRFDQKETVFSLIRQDLSTAAGQHIQIDFYDIADWQGKKINNLPGQCLDDLDITVENFELNPALLQTSPGFVEETVHSHLLKSNCLVTGQPDWGSVAIRYAGKPIDHNGLLKYIVSCRNHNEFNEHCVERIFVDLLRYCEPERLTVYAAYTRRGGLDTSPFRSNFEPVWENYWLARQ